MSFLEIVRADPDVVAAVPLVRGTVALAEAPSHALQLFGVDLMAEEDLSRQGVATETSRRDLLRIMDDPRSVLLSTTLGDWRDPRAASTAPPRADRWRTRARG